MSNKPLAVGDVDTFEDWRVAFNTLLSIAPEVITSPSSNPATTDDDYQVGAIWVREDTDTSWMLTHTTATNDAVWVALGSTPGALLNTGAVPLIANWNVGAFDITASRFISSVAQGTAPLQVTSTTVCPNLNVGLLGGLSAASFLRVNGSTPLSADWNVGAFDITNVGGFTSEMITANIVTSTRFDLGDVVAKFGPNTAATTYSLGRPVNTGTLNLTGGSSSGAGGNLILYGNSHATQGNDIEFRASGAIKLQWDHSANAWTFLGQNITNVGLVAGRDIATDGTKLDTIATGANNYTHPNHTGDVTGVTALTIGNAKVTNAKLANMAAGTIKVGSGAAPSDTTILSLTEQVTPISGDFLFGQEAGGNFRKFGVEKWLNAAAPILPRNPYRSLLAYNGTYGDGTTLVFDCEHYLTGKVKSLTGGTITLDLNFPTFASGAARGLTPFSLSGKIWVYVLSGNPTVNVDTTGTTNPFSGGFGAKGSPPFADDSWGILAWEFFDDGIDRMSWTEWVSEA